MRENGKRVGEVSRSTAETSVQCQVELDVTETEIETSVQTGLGFLDHMLTSLSRHGAFSLNLQCRGDLHVDDHHTVEDCAIVLGRALSACLGERRNFNRFGWAMVPMDEALARAAVDISGRPAARVELGLRREMLGDVAAENLDHFLRSLAVALGACIHVEVLYGENDHHRAEAAFKSLAMALRTALAKSECAIPSTKGVLE